MSSQFLVRDQGYYPSSEAIYDDEVDLYELWLTLYANKMIIILITLVSLAIGGLYAYLTPPTYEIKATYIPPNASDTAVLDIVKLRLPKLRVEDRAINGKSVSLNEYVYETFKQVLYSNELKRSVLRSYLGLSISQLEAEKIIDDYIDKNIKLSEPSIKKGKTLVPAITIKLTTKNKSKDVALLKNLIVAAEEQTRQRLLGDLAIFMRDEIAQREYLMTQYKKVGRKRRENRIIQLQEASKVAHTLGREKGQEQFSVNDNELYLRGFKELDALIASLKLRKDDSAFIPALVMVKSELELLRLPIDKSSLVVARLDTYPREPLGPVKPKKQLILALSGLLGLMLGVGFVFVRQGIITAKERHQQPG